MAETASEGDCQTFQLRRSVGITALFGVVLFAAFLVLAFTIPFLPGELAHPWIATILCSPVFAVLALLSWAMWKRRNEELRTNASRITWCPRQDRRHTMRWSDVVGIREYPVRQKLELTDLLRQRIPLEYQLTDFARLREIVRRNTPHLRERHALIREFRRHALSRWQNLLEALFSAGLAVAATMQGEALALAISLGFMVFAVALYGREVRSIDVGPTVLVLRRGFGSRVIPWPEVAGVTLLDVPGRAGPVQTVRILFREGKSTDINMVAEGTIPLCDAVEAAWKRAGIVP